MGLQINISLKDDEKPEEYVYAVSVPVHMTCSVATSLRQAIGEAVGRILGSIAYDLEAEFLVGKHTDLPLMGVPVDSDWAEEEKEIPL